MKVGVLAVAVLVAGCDSNSSKSLTIGEVTITEVETLLTKENAFVPVDVNGAMVRKEFGILPGAVLLSHYKKYKLSELPKDKAKNLIFYCSNESCGASHQAAQVALNAGYSNVDVLSAGIMGWSKAKKPTSSIQ